MGGTFSKTFVCWCVAAIMAVTLGSCTPKLRDKFNPEKYDKIDRGLSLSRSDYKKMSDPKIPDLINTVEVKPAPPPPLPSLSEILAAPKPPELGKTQLVSIAVTDDVPLKDVLLELSRLANVDMELDSGISGGISFIAHDKPFNEVISRISELAGLRFQMTEGILRVERDLPYVESYSLDFLNVDRSGTSSINISTNAATSSGTGGINSGSTQSITSTSQSDFWNSLQSGIKQILNYSPKKRSTKTKDFEVDGTEIAPEALDAAGGAAPVAAATIMPGMEDCAIMTQGGVPVATASGGMSGGDCQTFYTINRQAGVLTVSATKKQHDLIERFIGKIKENASAQVLIEAKIVEITLNDQYQSGVQWSAINRKLGVVNNFNTVTQTGGVFTAKLPPRTIDGVTIGGTGGNSGGLDDFLQLVENFGTTRTLSSPRLHAINNQQAVLTFAENFVYFELKVQQQQTTTATGAQGQPLITVDSTVKTVPIGIILNLQPSVNTETGEITLVVRPTLSRITSFVEDPAVAFIAAQNNRTITNKVPVVEVRELDSILKLKSGQVMVIGGLMQNTASNKDRGLPGVSEVPWIGNLFKSVNKEEKTQELIIFIRATLVSPNGSAAPADKSLYKEFTKDPRPLKFED